MLTKNCSYIRGIYFFVCTFCSALMLMEVPKIVFYAPLIVFILFVADRIITKEDFNFDVASGFLFLFIFVYVYFTYSDSSSLYYQSYIHIHAFFYYFIGINFLKGYSNEEKKQFIEASLIIISVIYIVYVVLTLLNYELFTDADLKLRHYYSFWYDDVSKAATAFSVAVSLPLSYGLYALFFSSLPKKILGAFFVACTIGINIYTGTRALLYMAPVLFIIVMLCWLVLKKKKYTWAAVSVAVCIVAAITVGVLINKNYAVIVNAVKDKPIHRLFTVSLFTSSRFEFIKNIIDNFSFTYMGGYKYAASGGQVHNVWLNYYDAGGIISFALFVLFTVFCIINFVKLIFNKNINVDIKVLFCMIIGMITVQFTIEPLVAPIPSYYVISMFYLGSVYSFDHTSKQNKLNI